MSYSSTDVVLAHADTLRASIADLGPMSEGDLATLSGALQTRGLTFSPNAIAKIMGRRPATSENVLGVLRNIPRGMFTTPKNLANALKSKGWQRIGTALKDAQGIADLGACVIPLEACRERGDAFRFDLDEVPFWVVDEQGNATEQRRERARYLAERGVTFRRYSDPEYTVEDPDGQYIVIPRAGQWWKPEEGDVEL